jgi:hypothetical protein
LFALPDRLLAEAPPHLEIRTNIGDRQHVFLTFKKDILRSPPDVGCSAGEFV